MASRPITEPHVPAIRSTLPKLLVALRETERAALAEERDLREEIARLELTDDEESEQIACGRLAHVEELLTEIADFVGLISTTDRGLR